MNNIKLLYIDLFCGAGGTSTGVENARLNGRKCAKVVACVNHDATAIASHQAHHRPTPESIKVSAHVVKVLSEASDDALLAEIQRRANWHGDFTIERKYTL